MGEASGVSEDKTGIPFVGRAGKLLDKWIEYLELRKDEYAVTNILKCHPPNNRDPTPEEINNCSPFLKKQIELLKPEIIVLVGRFAMEHFLKVKGIMRNAGQFFGKYFVVIHPAYYLRNEQKGWRPMLEPLKNKMKGIEEKKIEKVCVTRADQLNDMMLDLGDKKEITVDTETTELNISKLKLLGISLYAGGEKSYYIPVGHHNAEQINLGIVLFEVSNLLKETNIIIAHNIIYDAKVLNKYELDLEDKNWFCTMVASHILFENRKSIGLKHLAKQELNMVMKHLTDIIDLDKLAYVNVNKMADYSCDDVIATWRLFKIYKQELEEKGLHELFYDIEMPFLKVIKHMEEVGVLIDKDKFSESEKRLINDINILESKIAKLAGVKVQASLVGENRLDIDLSSTKQMRTLLFDKLNLPILYKTPKGFPATGIEVLEKLKDKHIIIPLIIKHRKLKKLLDAFIVPLPKRVDEDGRIRTSFRDCGTKTGRLSSDNPNMQQLPRDDNYDVRACFIASPNHKLIAIDYSQEELRVAAHICDDLTMIEAYKEGKDFHLIVANKIFNLELDNEQLTIGNDRYAEAKKKFGELRQMSKAVSFGILYGIGPETLAERICKTKEEAKKIIGDYFRQFPKVRQKIRQTGLEVDKKGFVRNLFGRYRHFNKQGYGGYSGEDYRKSFNFLIQSFGADLLRVSCREIYKKFKGSDLKILLLIHDEIVIECKEENAEKYLPIIKDIMENCVQMEPKLIAEGKIGRNYSEAK